MQSIGMPGLPELVIIAFVGLLFLLFLVGVVFAIVYMTKPGRESPDNPNLTACRDCGRMISVHATACPHCGSPRQPMQAGPSDAPGMGGK